MTVEDLLVAFLMNDPKCLSNEKFSKIKIRLADFELFEKEERMRYLLAEFEKAGEPRRRFGVDRVDLLLEPFDLSGQLNPDTKKEIRPMHFTRNVLVHRASTADRKIVEGCPWLGLVIGQPIVVTLEMFVAFSNALNDYATEIMHVLMLDSGLIPESRQLPALRLRRLCQPDSSRGGGSGVKFHVQSTRLTSTATFSRAPVSSNSPSHEHTVRICLPLNQALWQAILPSSQLNDGRRERDGLRDTPLLNHVEQGIQINSSLIWEQGRGGVALRTGHATGGPRGGPGRGGERGLARARWRVTARL